MDLGNLILGLQIPGLAALDALEARLAVLDRTPHTVTLGVNTGAVTQAEQHVASLGTAHQGLGNTPSVLKMDVSQVEAARTSVKNLDNDLLSLVGTAGKLGPAMAAAVAAGGLTKFAADYQTTLVTISNQTNMTTADIGTMDQAIRDLPTGGASFKDIATGFKNITDLGYSAADATKIAAQASKAATATGSDQATVMLAITSAMKEYNATADQAGKYTNIVAEASRLANSSLQAWTEGTRTGVAVAAAYGVSLQEADAFMVALTRHGFDASESATQLRGVIQHIVNESPNTVKEIANIKAQTGIDLSMDFGPDAIRAQGFTKIMQDLQDVVAKTGDDSIVTKLIPALRGGQGALITVTQAAQDSKEALILLGQAGTGAITPVDDAFARIQKTAGYQFAQTMKQLKLDMIDLGAAFLPVATQMAEALGKIPPGAIQAAAEIALFATGVKAAAAVGDLLVAMAARLVPAFVASTAAESVETVAVNANTASWIENAAARARALGLTAVAGVGLAYGAQQVDQAVIAPDVKNLRDQTLQDINKQLSNGQTTLDQQIAMQQQRAADMQKANDQSGWFGLPNPDLRVPGGVPLIGGSDIGRPFPTGVSPVGDLPPDGSYSDTQVQAQQAVVADLIRRKQEQDAYLMSVPKTSTPDTGPGSPAGLQFGPKQLTDEEQAALYEHQYLLDQKRAELAAKGTPQRLIDVTTDENGIFSKTEIAMAKRDLAEWDALYKNSQAQRTEGDRALTAAYEEQKRQVQAVGTANEEAATKSAEAWKAANAEVGKIAQATDMPGIAGTAGGLDTARANLADLGKSNGALDLLTGIADKFAAIVKATDAAKAAFVGYSLTLSETDKSAQQLDGIKKRYLDALDAAEKRQRLGTSTAADDQLVASRTSTLATFTQQQEGLSKNASADMLSIVQHLPDFVAIDTMQRSTIAQMGGGAAVIGSIQLAAATAEKELTDLEKKDRQAVIQIKADTAKALADIDTLIKAIPADKTIRITTTYGDAAGNPAGPPLPPGSDTNTPHGDASALAPLAPLIQKYAAEYGVPSWLLGSIIMHESGGVVGKREVGGGDGHGLTQIDTGPYGGNIYDPRLDQTDAAGADYQVQQGAKVLQQKINAAGGVEKGTQWYAGPAYQSEAGGGVPAGLDLYSELSTYYKAQVDAVLYGGASAQGNNGQGAGGATGYGAADAATTVGNQFANLTPTAAGSSTPAILDEARRSIGQKLDRFGRTVYGWCEEITDDIVQNATGKDTRFASADAHIRAAMAGQPGAGSVVSRANARPGDLVGWTGDSKYAGDPAGHIGVYSGNNNYIGTTANGVQERVLGPDAIFIRPDGVVAGGPVPGSVVYTGKGTAAPGSAAATSSTAPAGSIPDINATKTAPGTAPTVFVPDLSKAVADLTAQIAKSDPAAVKASQSEFTNILPTLQRQEENRIDGGDPSVLTPTDKQNALNAATEKGLEFQSAWLQLVTDIAHQTGNIAADQQRISDVVGGPMAANLTAQATATAQIEAANERLVQLQKDAKALDDAHQQVVRDRQIADEAAARQKTMDGWAAQDAQNRLADRQTAENVAYTAVQRGFQDRQRELQFSQQVGATDLQNKLTDLQKQQQETTYQRTGAEQITSRAARTAATPEQAAVLSAQLAGMHDQDLAQKDLNKKAIDDLQMQIREEAKKANLDSYNLQTQTIAAQRSHEDRMQQFAAEGTAQQRNAQAQQRADQIALWQLQDKRNSEDQSYADAKDANAKAQEAEKQVVASAQAELDLAKQAEQVFKDTGAVLASMAPAAASGPTGGANPFGATVVRQLGAYAVGGEITTPYALVGERGPEIIRAKGYVVTPNGGAMSGGGATTVNLNLGSVTLSESDIAEIRALIQRKIDASKRAGINRMRALGLN